MTESSLIARWPAFAPYLRSVLRIVAAFPFILSGTMKTFAFPAGIPPWLYFSAAGAGPWSLDALRRGGRD